MILVYIANKKGDRMGGIVSGRDVVDASTNARKEVSRRGGDFNNIMIFSI